MVKASVTTFYDKDTGTAQHVCACPETKRAAIIDSVLSIDPISVKTDPVYLDKILQFVTEQQLQVDWILETHAHADHISGAQYLKSKLGGKVQTGIGQDITQVQQVFAGIYGLSHLPQDGSQFDHLFKDEEKFKIGNLDINVMCTPGHTPACVAYYIPNDVVFVGDTIFMPDSGTARCDFPLGSAEILWKSIQKLLALPDETRIFMCHDYGKPGARDPQWETTVGKEKAENIHVKLGTEMAQFIKLRTERDATLTPPKLIVPSVQVNINAGKFLFDAEGKVMLKYPVNSFVPTKGETGVITDGKLKQK